jgi:hypothetical protein
MPKKIKQCYLCRATENLTRDHIPPENLFPKPLPSNRITVPCCKSCNSGFSKIDEQFRAFVSSAANVSSTGTEVMRHRVFGGSFKRSPALKAQMRRGVFTGALMTGNGPMAVPLITMEKGVLNPFFTRLTKGLLATYHSEVDYFTHSFIVTQLSQFADKLPAFRMVKSTMEADQRGDGVFRFWHRVCADQDNSGIWVFQFYDAAIFRVAHYARGFELDD